MVNLTKEQKLNIVRKEFFGLEETLLNKLDEGDYQKEKDDEEKGYDSVKEYNKLRNMDRKKMIEHPEKKDEVVEEQIDFRKTLKRMRVK
jgi:pyruvate/2-oxoacid:ferredoxin oxidoreductase beta subunit